MQSHLVVLADGEKIDAPTQEPNLVAFLASLSSAWRAGEIRPTHRLESKPRYLRQIQSVVRRDTSTERQTDRPRLPCVAPITAKPKVIETNPPIPQLNPEIEKQCGIRRQAFARRHIQRPARVHTDLATGVPPTRRATQHECHRVVRRTTRPISEPLASRSTHGLSVVVFDFGVKTPEREVSTSDACSTDSHPNRALVVALIHLKPIVQKCFIAWKPTRTKPRKSSCPFDFFQHRSFLRCFAPWRISFWGLPRIRPGIVTPCLHLS
jgi:hypothetical protein